MNDNNLPLHAIAALAVALLWGGCLVVALLMYLAVAP